MFLILICTSAVPHNITLFVFVVVYVLAGHTHCGKPCPCFLFGT